MVEIDLIPENTEQIEAEKARMRADLARERANTNSPGPSRGVSFDPLASLGNLSGKSLMQAGGLASGLGMQAGGLGLAAGANVLKTSIRGLQAGGDLVNEATNLSKSASQLSRMSPVAVLGRASPVSAS